MIKIQEFYLIQIVKILIGILSFGNKLSILGTLPTEGDQNDNVEKQ